MEKGKGIVKWNGEMTARVETEMTPEEVAEVKATEIMEDANLKEMLKVAIAHAGEVNYSTGSKRIPIELLITLRHKKLPIKAIARIVRCSSATVRERLKKAGAHEVAFIDEFKKNRADVLAYHQRRILGSIGEGDLNDASLKDKTQSFGVLYDKERVEIGKQTGGLRDLKINIINFSEGGGKSIVVIPPTQNEEAIIE